jgi:hypothetical protein
VGRIKAGMQCYSEALGIDYAQDYFGIIGLYLRV